MIDLVNTPARVIEHTDDENVMHGTLVLIQNLFAALHMNKMRYCHWKSNEHLKASMTADTDLDILFDKDQEKDVERLLTVLQFKKFKAIRQKQYKDIEDYIGLDINSGKVVHLHAHFRLTLGETYLKSYQLNIENEILDSSVYDQTFGLYRIQPAFEFILLFFRVALKIRNRDIFRMYVHKEVQCSANMLKEYKWLKQHTNDGDIEMILKKILVNYAPVYALVTGSFNKRQLLKLSTLLRKELKECRLFSPLHALLLRWYREMSIKTYKKTARLFHRPIVAQRINPRGGLIIAVIGADGSGKSTVVTNLQATFTKKLDVYRVYLGNGRADARSWQRKLLIMLKKRTRKQLTHPEGMPDKSRGTEEHRSLKSRILKSIEALVIAEERYTKLKRMQAAKKKGMLVICDRFPQRHIAGFNDGPMLSAYSKSTNPFFKLLYKLEARVYTWAQRHPPDVVVKLIADAETIQLRKPSMASLQMLQAKVKGIKELTFEGNCRVVTVDALQPLEQVLYTVKKELWNSCP